ncbi:MAG: radical SAM protein [Elusimicrobiales bacterium]|nr:radical SAM protein [Elusimicrobiales bacterium]
MNNIIKDDNKLVFDIFVNSKNFFNLIERIYEILNTYEDRALIYFKNIPYCYLPEAFDHIIYKPLLKTKRIKICSNCRLKKLCSGVEDGSVFDIKSKYLKPVLSTPDEVVIEITNRCNMKCLMCGVNKNNQSTLDYIEIKKVIDDTKKSGIKNIRFTGGEPLLHPDILKILHYSKKNGFYVILNSVLTAERKIIKNLTGDVDNVLVSIHGYNAESEKKITGMDMFDLKLKNTEYISKYVDTVRIGSIITKSLINNFDKYIKIISPKIKVWELYRPMVSNDFIKKNTDFDIRIKDFKILIKKITKVKVPYKICIANPLPFCMTGSKNYNILLGGKFDDGNSRLVFDVNGYFKPSYYINFNLGKNISEAWKNKKLRTITYERHIGAECRDCCYLLRCYSGSRFLGYVKKNKFLTDPLLK